MHPWTAQLLHQCVATIFHKFSYIYVSKVWLHQFQFIQVSAQLNLFMGRNPEDSNLSQRVTFTHLDYEFTHELHI